jgi:hypothetical protein
MIDDATHLEKLYERAEDYSKTTVKLFKLSAIDKSADVVSSLISRLVIFLTVLLSIIIISIGLSLCIGKALGESFYGFFIIGGFYAFAAILIHIFRYQWIKFPVSNSIIKQMMK